MKFSKEIAQAFTLIKRNLYPLIAFEIIYKFLVITIAVFFIQKCVEFSLVVTGVKVLSQSNFISWILNPFSILIIIFVVLFAAFSSLIDVMAVTYALHGSYYKEKVTAGEMLEAGVNGALRIISPHNWGIIFFLLILVPLTGSINASGFIASMQLPGFIRDYINAHNVLSVLFGFITAILWFLAFIWRFSLHIFYLEKTSYTAACKKSRHLVLKHWFHSLCSFWLWSIFVFFLTIFLVIIAVVPAFLLAHKMVLPEQETYVRIILLMVISTMVLYLQSLFIVPFNFTYLSSMYYTYLEKYKMPIPPFTPEKVIYTKYKKTWKSIKIIAVIALVLSVIGGATDIIVKHMLPQLMGTQEIAAHRGSSLLRPENTMAAYEQAVLEGCEWIEIDVHQTKDGVIIVSHDPTLKRVAGVDIAILDHTYDELKNYDVGSWFSPEYSHLRLMTLDEVIKALNGRIKINIELKPTGKEENFEENVIAIVKENDFIENSVLSSLNANTLKRIKEISPEIQTLYVMAFVQGNLNNADFADGYSIEESRITSKLVNSVHQQGKKIWAWTLNDATSVSNMQALNVDYILTDDPLMARASLITRALPDRILDILNSLSIETQEVNRQELLV